LTGDDAPRRWPPASGGGPRRRATGLGLARRLGGAEAGAAAAATLRLLDDGSFALAAGLSTSGGADEAGWSDAAAAILDVPAQAVVSAAADTDTAPFEAGEPAPADFAVGRAVEEAARLLREQIREAGAGLLGAPPGEVTVAGGAVRVAGDGRAVSFAEIGSAALRAGRPLAATAAPVPASVPACLAAATAEVELDAETGVLRVVRLATALAGGPFADPHGPESQVEGALASAVELALGGGLGFDGEGRPLARSLRRWPLVSAQDTPPLAIRFVPAGEPLSRFGAGALGDAAGRAALAAIVNAASTAAGARLRQLPLGPSAILSVLEPPTRR
jgi:xanthine dehydrogenase molybdenum-binding subunit